MSDEQKPVPQEVLDRLDELEGNRKNLGLQLLDVENTRIAILAASRRIDEERNKIFQALLQERGLPLNTPVSIDPETRILSIIKEPSE